jgi:trans-aconitate methyltransferase
MMDDRPNGREQKPATAARIYDYVLGGTHNFPADREAAELALKQLPFGREIALAHRAVLRRMVRHMADAGVRQFLDIGSGMPTEGNVHEIAQDRVPDARVVYVDIDPMAVAESQELLEGNDRAIAVRGDVRDPQGILTNPQVRRLLDFDEPVGLLLMAIVHFVTDDAEAADVVDQLVEAVVPGSYLALTHGAADAIGPSGVDKDSWNKVENIYKQRTATPIRVRTREQVSGFFERCDLVEPGLVWMTEWRPAPGDAEALAEDPRRSGSWAGLGKIKK